MTHEISPAVERACEAARASATRHRAEAVRLTDWLLALLEDDESKPALLLERLGLDLVAIRLTLTTRAEWVHPPAPPALELFAAGRDKAIELRGDPTLTTEFVLLAVVAADARMAEQLAELGLHLDALEALLKPTVVAAPDATPGPTFTVSDPTEITDAGRVVDVNLNRARESLRVLDDYCRFVLNDALLTEQVKQLRHDLADASRLIPSGHLLAARNTDGDVGTAVSAMGEYSRQSPSEVAAANLKRFQEALRSLEEFGKVFSPEFGRRVEAVRYRGYTLERAIAVGTSARERLATANLYLLLTGAQCAASLDWTIAEAACGGVRVFQLREKTLTDKELLKRARNVRRWTHAAKALFIVNDRPDIARLVEADGVHLGQDDLPVHAARRILGPDALIGVSTHNLEQVRRAVLEGADYLGVGPTFPSKTKAFEQFPGLDFVRQVSAETSLPAFVLGGVEPGNVHEVITAGGRRVAVSAAIAQAEEPRDVAKLFRAELG